MPLSSSKLVPPRRDPRSVARSDMFSSPLLEVAPLPDLTAGRARAFRTNVAYPSCRHVSQRVDTRK